MHSFPISRELVHFVRDFVKIRMYSSIKMAFSQMKSVHGKKKGKVKGGGCTYTEELVC